MKITTFFLLIVIMAASASTRAQKVTLAEKNTSLEKIINEIRQQTGYDFIYDSKLIKNAKPVTINVTNVTIDEALNDCFSNQELTYELEDKTILIKEKALSILDKIASAFTNIDVIGRVLDEQGLPIASATITVKGTSNATITDAAGYFTLHNVDDKALIVISVIGYDKKEIPATKNIGDVKLVVAVNKLDELQIIAYGQTSQRLSTGNIASVSAKEIEEQPGSNPILDLEGRVPGLFITQASGVAGGGVTVRIQGQNSISHGNDPLYIIDGVPYASQMLTTTIGATLLGGAGGPGPSPLNFINPSDIENIEVLKDADATAIYGSRAANGAILITTKKGKTGASNVAINFQQGWQSTPELPVMNTQQYLAVRKEAFRNDGLIPSGNPTAASPYVYAPDLMFWDTTRNTNWQKVLLGNIAQYTNINASVSGGTNNVQYNIGGTYNNQGSTFPGNYADKKGTMHFSLNTVSANQKFRIQFSGNYMTDNNQLPSTDLTVTAIQLSPDAPSLYNADGTLNWALNSLGNYTWINPLTYRYTPYQNTTNNLISNAIVSYRILPGLEISSNLGYNKLDTKESSYTLYDALPPSLRPLVTLSANYSDNTISTWIVEPQITYKTTIGKGKLDALLGTTIQQNSGVGLTYTGTGYTTEAQLPDIKSATSTVITASTNSQYRYNALFGRLNYNWDNKYILDLNARRDGSSRFGANSQFHDFGSAGAAWIFTEEKLLKNDLKLLLSFGKLKASYGTTGSDQIGDYQFMNLYAPQSYGIPYQGVGSIGVTSLNNPYLQWEETRKLQFGIDLGFLQDRILLNATYELNRTSNQLLAYQLPTITGFGSIFENFPATVQNTSLEFSLNTQNIKSTNFSWTSSINLTIPQNKLVAFPNLATSTYASSLIIGQPVGIKKAYHFLGVDPASGLYRVADRFGNPTSSPSQADQTVLYNTLPKLYGGFQNNIRYKGLQLDFLFQFVQQTGLYPGVFGVSPGKALNGDLSLFEKPHWQQPGDISSVQRYSTNNSSVTSAATLAGFSDAAIVNASYIRLKNVSLSYQIPENYLHSINLKNARVYMQAQNLFTITKYPGVDPENQSVNSLPPLRVITMGLQLGF